MGALKKNIDDRCVLINEHLDDNVVESIDGSIIYLHNDISMPLIKTSSLSDFIVKCDIFNIKHIQFNNLSIEIEVDNELDNELMDFKGMHISAYDHIRIQNTRGDWDCDNLNIESKFISLQTYDKITHYNNCNIWCNFLRFEGDGDNCTYNSIICAPVVMYLSNPFYRSIRNAFEDSQSYRFDSFHPGRYIPSSAFDEWGTHTVIIESPIESQSYVFQKKNTPEQLNCFKRRIEDYDSDWIMYDVDGNIYSSDVNYFLQKLGF